MASSELHLASTPLPNETGRSYEPRVQYSKRTTDQGVLPLVTRVTGSHWTTLRHPFETPSAVPPATVLNTINLLNGTLNAGNIVPENATNPDGIALDPQDGRLFVSSYGGAITVINASTNRLIRIISTGGALPAITYDSSNGDLYATQPEDDDVIVVNATTFALAARILVGAVATGIAFDPSNGDVYVAMLNNVTVIDGATNQIVTRLIAGTLPTEVTVGNGLIFVSNFESDNVTIIDGATNHVVGAVSVGLQPEGMAFDPRNGYLYVADQCGIPGASCHDISVVDISAQYTVVTISVGICPWGVAYDSSNGIIYVTDTTCTFNSGGITLINTTTNKVVGSISPGYYPSAIIFDIASGDVYVADEFSDDITVIDGMSQKVVYTVGVGTYPSSLAYDSSNGDIYVTNLGTNNVSVINGRTGLILGAINVGFAPDGIAYDKSNGYLYVANYGSNNVSVIDTRSGQVTNSIAVGNGPVAVTYDSATGFLFVANRNSNNVTVINGSINEVASAISVGTNPKDLTYDALNGYIYVADLGSLSQTPGQTDYVTVVNGLTDKVVGSIAVGTEPYGVVYDSIDGFVYVSNDFTGNLTVINGSTDRTIGSVHLGLYPLNVAVDGSNGDVYASTLRTDTSNPNSNSLAVVDGLTDTFLGAIPVGTEPAGICFDLATGNGFVANELSGTVSVFHPTIDIPTRYNVTFKEAGLLTGTAWYVDFNSTGESSTTNEIAFSVINGVYSFSVSGPLGYVARPSSSSVQIHGSNVTIRITFAQIEYVVSFIEDGLPVGTPWSVQWNGTWRNTTATAFQFEAPNGTYEFAVGTMPNLSASPSAGPVVISGSNTTQYIDFILSMDSVPSIVTFSAFPTVLSVNNPVLFTVVAKGGKLPLAYSYAGLPKGCTSINSSQLLCTPTEIGRFYVTVEVKDTLLRFNYSTLLVVVTEPTLAKSAPVSRGISIFGLPQTESFVLILGALSIVAVLVILGWWWRKDPATIADRKPCGPT